MAGALPLGREERRGQSDERLGAIQRRRNFSPALASAVC